MIYYPEDKLELIKSQEQDLEDWYQVTLNQLVRVCRNVSSKYTRSKVRKALPKEFSYIIQELLHESSVEPNKSAYVDQIICTIISTGRADDFIIAMCNLIQRLTIDLLHIIGDIFDRGAHPDEIMDFLMDFHDVDFQWGQPRHRVDGRGDRKLGLHHQSAAHEYQLQQLRHAGGRLRHQSAAAGVVRRKGLRR